MNTKPTPTEQEVITAALLRHVRKLEEMILLLSASLAVSGGSAFSPEGREHHRALIGPRVVAIKAQSEIISATARRLKP
jgi:hypothetical protein